MKKLDIKPMHFEHLEAIMDREGVCKCPIVCVSQQPSGQPNWLDPWSCDVVLHSRDCQLSQSVCHDFAGGHTAYFSVGEGGGDI